MDKQRASKIVSDRFTYISDKEKYKAPEAWVVMNASMEGDCEDYALTVLYYICDKNYSKLLWKLLTYQAVIMFCKVGEEGHAILYYKGETIDNIFRDWTTIKTMKEKGYNFRTFGGVIHLIPGMSVLKLLIGSLIRGIKNA